MTTYQTTRAIKSLAKGGVNLDAMQPVSPAAFTSSLWDALINEGVIVAITEQPETAVSFDDMTLDELKAMADESGVAYTWNIKKETLIERLDLWHSAPTATGQRKK